MMFIEEASVGQRTLNHSFDWGKVIWGVIIVTKRVLLTTTTLMVAGHQSCHWGKVGFFGVKFSLPNFYVLMLPHPFRLMGCVAIT